MSISKFNHEGYYDPVPFEAVKNIESKDKKQPLKRKNQKNRRINQRYFQNNQKNINRYQKNQNKNQKKVRISQKNHSSNRMVTSCDTHQFKIAYICSPLRGDMEHNINMARSYCRFAVSKAYIPLAVHLLFTQFMDDSNENERGVALRMGTALLAKADVIWVFGNNITTGMDMEIAEARRINLPIRLFTDQCMEVE